MVQLVVYNQSNGNSSYLDLGDVSIKADYSSVEIQDITKRKSESSQAFTIPFTDTNNSFFSHFYNVNASGDFDSNSKVKASILVDSIEVLDGYLQLLKVDTITENYDVVVMGDVANIVKSLGTDLLTDLDIYEFSHTFSKANIENSWDGEIEYYNSTTGDEILYPLIDYGYGINDSAINGGSVSGYLSFNRLKPAIKVKTVFYKILEGLGYTINSNFLTSAFFTSQYMTMANESQKLPLGQPDYFKASYSTSQGISTPEVNLKFDQIDNNRFNNFVASSSGSDAYYDVPVKGYYQFRIRLYIDPVGTEPYLDYRLRVKEGANTLTSTTKRAQSYGNWVTFTTGDLALDSSDIIKFTIDNYGYYSGNANITQGSVEILKSPLNELGETLEFLVGSNLLPEEKQSDFISSILSRYNLSLEIDKDNPSQLNIETVQDYFNSGTSKDWTDKLDTSKNIIIKPTSEYQSSELFLSDVESDDKQNKEHQEQVGVPYNSHSIKFNNDFAQNEKREIKSIFSSYTNQYFNTNDAGILVGQQFAYDGETPTFVKTKSKLFVYSGLKDATFYMKENDTDSNNIVYTQFPFCSTYHMSGDAIDNSDYDIRFRSIAKFGELNYIDEQVTEDTISKCWQSYLNNLYSKDARILIANFNLNSIDIANFNYNDKIFVKDAYYRVNKIKGYAIGKDLSTQVELIKIVEEKAPTFTGCDLILHSVYYNIASFRDTSGNPAPPTRICCESLGFRYVAYSGGGYCDASSNKSLRTITHTTTTTEEGDTTLGRSGSRISIEGTISKLGEDANDGQILSWSDTDESTRWITFPDELELNDGKIIIGDSNGNASKSTLQGDANISITTDDAGGTTTISLDNVPAAGTNGEIQVNDNGDLGTGTGLSYVGTSLIVPNITATGDVDVTGDVTADNFIGDGSQLTNLPTSSSGSAGVIQQSDGSGGFISNSNLVYSGGNTLNVPNISASGLITGKQRQVINCGFYHGTSSIVYLPFGYGGTNDSTSSSGYLEFGGYVVPCDGYVEYVVVRGESPGGNTTVGFVKASAGTEVPVLSGASGLSDTVNMLYDDTAYRFDNFRNQGGVVTNTFSAGDVIMFTLNTTNPLYDAISTAVLVFDWNNQL